MKHWALIIAALYFVILTSLTVPAILLAFAPQVGPKDAAEVYLHWQYWLWLAIMGASQCALLTVPVRLAGRRPVSRGPVWRTILGGALMAGGLAIGAFLSLDELLFGDHALNHDPKTHWDSWLMLTLGALSWCLWAVIFARMSRRVPPADLVSRQCQWLFKGSVLELLIAVPTHIIVRCREYCCAGFLTFIGLTMGFSVMLFAFGPAVFILFLERWKRLHPASPNPASTKTQL